MKISSAHLVQKVEVALSISGHFMTIDRRLVDDMLKLLKAQNAEIERLQVAMQAEREEVARRFP
jgi:hypothetical protein